MQNNELNFGGLTLRLFCLVVIVALCLPDSARAVVNGGAVKLTWQNLKNGDAFDLAGKWLYRPGYSIGAGEKPETGPSGKLFDVPVPQLLNRIRWWLDDSEDFNKHETERLKALGFDTDRAEDGWYYLKLDLPEFAAGRHVFIQFDGVAMISRVYCNGRFLGEHKGMFSRFEYDLTPSLKPGENLLAVFVSMEKIPPSTLTMGQAVTVNLTASKVRSMSKGMYGPLWPSASNRDYDLHGIWQPVRLVVRGGVELDDVWFRPSLTNAEVQVEAHALDKSGDAWVGITLTNRETSEVIFRTMERIHLQTNVTTQTFRLNDLHPKLWTPAEPNLYRLKVELGPYGAGFRNPYLPGPLDSWSHDVGFRTFEVKGNQFFLNGHPYWLRGADHLPYGKNPFDPALPRKLIQSLHDANIRITRTHATPWNETWLTAADEIGLGVSLEGIRPWALSGAIGPTPPDLFAHWLMENEDVVKRARNHPSVFIYTVGNEMLLKDTKNIDKWKQLSEVVKQTRQVDPTRPVICSSEYARDPQFYNDSLKPNGIDDGDADDLHRYNNWYGPSSFVTDAKLEREVKNNGGIRPLMGQEMSTGYPDLDTGLPVFRYTHDLVTPQAWIGNASYPGNDPATFLEHHRAVTKRWAERLRFERGTNTAGFMLFATECWFSHSYDAATVKPYPVLDAVRDAYAPIGLALETGCRHFYQGRVNTAVFVSNDSEDYTDLSAGQLEAHVLDRVTGRELDAQKLGSIDSVPYCETLRVPVSIFFNLLLPEHGRKELTLELRLLRNGTIVSATRDYVDVFSRGDFVLDNKPWPRIICTNGGGAELSRFSFPYMRMQSPVVLPHPSTNTNLLQRVPRPPPTTPLLPPEPEKIPEVWLIGTNNDFDVLKSGGAARVAIENGVTAIVFSPGEKLNALFPRDIEDVKNAPGEYADFSPCAGTLLAENLQPMDLKWWGRKNDWRVFVANASHRLKPGGTARELIRYIPPHGYIPAEKVKEQYRTVLFEIPLGKGRLWVCDLDLEASVSVDPLAQQFAVNMLRAAADLHSTDKLPHLLSHEELSTRNARK